MAAMGIFSRFVRKDDTFPVMTSRQAIKNLRSETPNCRWLSGKPVGNEGWEAFKPGEGADRVYKDTPAPVIKPKFTLPSDAKIFASGSCFAREIEKALYNSGQKVLSWTPELEYVPEEAFHRYTTHAIINDFIYALEGGWSEANIVQLDGMFIDYTGHGGFDSMDKAVRVRKRIIDTHKNISEAGVLFVTLGFIEAWFDKQTLAYTNTAPFGQMLGKRFELRITDFNENLKSMRRFISMIRRHRPELKIIVTVSPVPLKETFSGQDIVIANTYSKSVLRAVAQEVAFNDPLTDYFPSYEMVTLADPNAAWLPDHRHVRPEYVAKIVEKFRNAYMA